MSRREKDSAIVYELVTSKYKIAERNRVAKMRFLNDALKSDAVKRRDSEPSLAKVEKTEVQRVDISVPGTPVSSRYIASLKKLNHKNFDSDSETENEDNNDDNDGATDNTSQFNSVLEASLKKFTDDMEKLQKNDDNLSHDPLKKYFEESDRQKTYRRDFSEVVSEFPIQKKEPETIKKVERYFQESERLNSFKRDFSDAFRTFDPQNPTGRDQFTDLNKIGTPISSRLIASEKLSSALENKPKSDIKISNEIEIVENDKNSQVHLETNGIQDDVISKTIENGNALKIIEDDDDIPVKKEEEEQQIESNDVKRDEIPKKLKRSDSASSEISVPGTPVSSRDLRTLRNRNFIDTDDSGSEDEDDGSITKDSIEIKTLAQEFVNEIENLVQKSFDDDRQEIALEELKKITTQNVDTGEISKPQAAEGESDEKLIIHEEQREVSNPDGLMNKVEAYFEKSEKENTYTRTFSEVETFNTVSDDVKQRVENYFKESDEKKSLTRPFSQVINYVEPKIDFNQLTKPGTPVSSATVECLKKKNKKNSVDTDPEVLKGQEALRKAQDALHIDDKTEFAVDDYFKQSQERQTYQRNFSEVLDQLNKTQIGKNPDIEKYFEESDATSSFQRPFSQVIQSVPPRIDEILKEEERPESKNAPLHYQRSSRASSISSNCSDLSEGEHPRKTKKHGKKYGIDKYFATSLYRTAYHRSNSRRTSRDGEHTEELKILEDEDVFGETDLLRQQTFQHDDETAVTQGPNDVNENQSVQFWRDFLKPYNLNLQTEITITKDELINNRTLE